MRIPVCLIIFLIPCAFAAEGDPVLVDSELFSVVPPENWRVRDGGLRFGPHTTLVIGPTEGDSNPFVLIHVEAQKTAGTLLEYCDTIIKSLPAEISVGTKAEIQSDDGQKLFRYVVEQLQNNVPVKKIIYMTDVKDGRRFLLTAWTRKEGYARLEPVFDKIVKSFKGVALADLPILGDRYTAPEGYSICFPRGIRADKDANGSQRIAEGQFRGDTITFVGRIDEETRPLSEFVTVRIGKAKEHNAERAGEAEITCDSGIKLKRIEFSNKETPDSCELMYFTRTASGKNMQLWAVCNKQNSKIVDSSVKTLRFIGENSSARK